MNGIVLEEYPIKYVKARKLHECGEAPFLEVGIEFTDGFDIRFGRLKFLLQTCRRVELDDDRYRWAKFTVIEPISIMDSTLPTIKIIMIAEEQIEKWRNEISGLS